MKVHGSPFVRMGLEGMHGILGECARLLVFLICMIVAIRLVQFQRVPPVLVRICGVCLGRIGWSLQAIPYRLCEMV